ncbi:uncharacterized protein LOC129602237 [Paramacrobiotus metropolitanus]|uniref:uncharacterized protein LOC129602237 n=1 Tax=Paramacrobiotus metropolitanus TaxID=2943436 RepID=UPI0024459AD6|nr:uncharacterized protein LOC129602237 [Paramacrobiotus metropolitanus]XP_055357208.1 uncharacterized protein LOC129602237 [Paramacrobiotus metropolitanus]
MCDEETSFISSNGLSNVRKAARVLQMWPQLHSKFPAIWKKITLHLDCDQSTLLRIANELKKHPDVFEMFARNPRDPIILLPPTSKRLLNGCRQIRKSKNGQQSDPSALHTHHDSPDLCTVSDIECTHTKCWRFNLRCRSCKSYYRYSTFFDSDKKKFFLYDTPRPYVEISRELCCTRRLCILITSDMYFKQCSFQAFSSSVQNAFGISDDYNRKQLAEAFFKYHIEEYLRRLGKLSVGLTAENDWDEALTDLNQTLRSELLPHDHYEICIGRGCRDAVAMDGNWKFSHVICSFLIKKTHSKFPLLKFPRQCTEEPLSGFLYCKAHIDIARAEGLPVTAAAERKARLNDTLVAAALETESDTAEIFTTTLACRKNLGQHRYLKSRSRGWLFFVTAGGIIRMFRPLYGSESSSQVFFHTVEYLFQELSTRNPADYARFTLCYDDMCHLNALRQAAEELPYPAPYSTMWFKVQKVIDRFHMRNHKPECFTKYNADEKLAAIHGNGTSINTESAEQVFSQLRNFKASLFVMGKRRQEFFLHVISRMHNCHVEKSMAKGCLPIHFNGRRRSNTM